MDETRNLSLEEIRALLAGSEGVEFSGQKRADVYRWVEKTLIGQEYGIQKRAGKGLIRQYVAKMTGLSRAQVTRLIGKYLKNGKLEAAEYERHRFTSKYRSTDVELLAYVDRMHGKLSGPATRRILQREHGEYGQGAYDRLAGISVAHIYRFRKTEGYRKRNNQYETTRPTQVSIGERRRPEPGGKPGYLRVDTVHQGDQDGQKGVYHINAVDQVTQWEVVAAVPQISEAFLLPVLEGMLEQFPFRISGFHSDNGSEYINHRVAGLLKKLLIEQTKSRPRHSNDNGLAECKNGAVIRKHIGWGHISGDAAEALNRYYREHFNPYLNFHRPCGIPEIVTSAKGKTKRVYRRWATPWEILSGLPDCESYLHSGTSRDALERLAQAKTDTEAARDMQEAKRDLFRTIRRKTA